MNQVKLVGDLIDLEVIDNGFNNKSYQRDGTELLMEIEGDILYIDPPYNTGHDFVYPDSFKMGEEEYNEGTKYFAEDGFKNYEIIDGDNENGTPITSWKSEPTKNKFCPNNKVATITINDNIEIEAWVGDGNEIIYLTNNENLFGKHIRPSESVVSKFYNECGLE